MASTTMTVFGVLSLGLALEGAFLAFRGLRQTLIRRHAFLALPPLALLAAAAAVSSGALSLVLGVGGAYFGIGLFFGGVAYAVIEDGKPHEPPPGGGDGGSGPEPPGPSEPGWWPEFEAQFRRYATRRGRRGRVPA